MKYFNNSVLNATICASTYALFAIVVDNDVDVGVGHVGAPENEGLANKESTYDLLASPVAVVGVGHVGTPVNAVLAN